MLLIGTGLSSVCGTELKQSNTISTLNFGNTLYVGGSGPSNYSTIQYAVDNASYLDTIFVYSGTYYENVKIYTSVVLIVTGFSIINSGSYLLEAGIELNRIEHCIILII